MNGCEDGNQKYPLSEAVKEGLINPGDLPKSWFEVPKSAAAVSPAPVPSPDETSLNGHRSLVETMAAKIKTDPDLRRALGMPVDIGETHSLEPAQAIQQRSLVAEPQSAPVGAAQARPFLYRETDSKISRRVVLPSSLLERANADDLSHVNGVPEAKNPYRVDKRDAERCLLRISRLRETAVPVHLSEILVEANSDWSSATWGKTADALYEYSGRNPGQAALAIFSVEKIVSMLETKERFFIVVEDKTQDGKTIYLVAQVLKIDPELHTAVVSCTQTYETRTESEGKMILARGSTGRAVKLTIPSSAVIGNEDIFFVTTEQRRNIVVQWERFREAFMESLSTQKGNIRTVRAKQISQKAYHTAMLGKTVPPSDKEVPTRAPGAVS